MYVARVASLLGSDCARLAIMTKGGGGGAAEFSCTSVDVYRVNNVDNACYSIHCRGRL